MKFLSSVSSLDRDAKKNLLFILVSYFCVLFNYPLIRASSTTLFFEAYGAKSTPTAWLWGVIFLSIAVYISNALQARYSVQRVFFIKSFLSVIIFVVGNLGFFLGVKFFTFLPFIWKEIYIVLQVHLILGYANNYFKGSDFKALIGLVGGVGSIGGILAGLLTRFLAERFGTNSVMWMGIIFTFIPALSFLKTKNLSRTIEDKARTPIASFDLNLKKYIGIVAAIVALSQVIINIADFNFHLVFEQTIKDSSERTSKLGDIYMYMNVVTFFLQFIVLPFVMLRTSEKNYHYFIPLSYFFFFMIVVLLFPNGLLPLSLFFIYLKASDYSLFSAGKEVLYQPLSINQKYGAKYLTDMLVYRFSKAMIALVLIYVQNSYILNIVMFICFFMWISLVSKLFNQQKLILN